MEGPRLARLCPSEPGLGTTGIRLKPAIRACFDRCSPILADFALFADSTKERSVSPNASGAGPLPFPKPERSIAPSSSTPIGL